ncbi:MAG TPA: LysR family transcriptional regulator [Gaiellaceae bacterium]|nr:LysR family transcriptional regulator [Gaiellaceae bacterium]
MKPDTWLGVELRHLAALEAVATEGSFGRAAQKLGYTQSAVSQQIAMLERLVGERLIDRPGGPRAVSLTEAGGVLLRHAASILARLQAAQADLAALSAGEAGSLRVGTIQSVGAKILPEVMRRFTGAWPKVEIGLVESHDDDVLAELVERGDLDLAFVQLPLVHPSLETIELLRDDYVLITSPDSPFARGRRPPTLPEIAQQPLIGFHHCRATSLVVDQLHATGHEPKFVFRSDDNGVVQGLAGAGIGVALVPRLTVDAGNDSVRIVELAAGIAPRSVGIAWHADRYHSRAAHAFVETAREVTGDAAVDQAA